VTGPSRLGIYCKFRQPRLLRIGRHMGRRMDPNGRPEVVTTFVSRSHAALTDVTMDMLFYYWECRTRRGASARTLLRDD
jgi:hypothetical protein